MSEARWQDTHITRSLCSTITYDLRKVAVCQQVEQLPPRTASDFDRLTHLYFALGNTAVVDRAIRRGGIGRIPGVHYPRPVVMDCGVRSFDAMRRTSSILSAQARHDIRNFVRGFDFRLPDCRTLDHDVYACDTLALACIFLGLEPVSAMFALAGEIIATIKNVECRA